MKKFFSLWMFISMGLMIPVLACGSLAGQPVTPTPTKTPRKIKLLSETPDATPTTVLILTTESDVSLSTDTPPPVQPVDTPTPEPLPTDTPTPEPPPTDTPPPPPPPTNTPAPPPPTFTPAPPPPTPAPVNQGPQVIVELPDGNTFDTGEKIKMVFVVRDPDGVVSFTWGIFTQNQVPLVGGDKNCGGATECRTEREESAPIPGTFIVGADAVDTKGNKSRGVGEIYVR